jgi:hypothetical protein
MPRPVFVGGAGQTGTSLLCAYLAHHRELLVCPYETNFILAAHGLLDVVRAVSDEYCAFRLDTILHEFDRLMRHDLCSPRSYPYQGFDLAAYFGAERYHDALDRFFARLGVTRYAGDGFTIGPGARIGKLHAPALRRVPLPDRIRRERSQLYACDRQPTEAAREAARGLLDDLFGAQARAVGKSAWCEQTSQNQAFADRLLDLYPDTIFIHAVRDPLDVALAQWGQPWAPGDFGLVCGQLAHLYDHWRAVRARLPAGAWCETRFEELTTAPEETLRRVCRAIGVAFDPQMLAVRPDPTRLAAESARRQAADLVTYQRILGASAEDLGYTGRINSHANA